MTPHDLLDGIGEVDEKLIALAEAEPEIQKKNNVIIYIKWGCIAAGILLVIGILVWFTKSGFLSIDPVNTNPSSLYASQPEPEESVESIETKEPEESRPEPEKENVESTETSESEETEETDESDDTKMKPRDILRCVPVESRPKLMQVRYAEDEVSYTPSVPAYKLNADLSNLANKEWFEFGPEAQEKIVRNGFVVADSLYIDEFYQVYEKNRYGYVPNFVTTDSIMHTYHLFYLKLQKGTEKGYLYSSLCNLTNGMLKHSMEQYEALKGSEWEEAAGRNVVFYGVAARLLQQESVIPVELESMVSEEVNKIMAAEGIYPCLITPENSEGKDPSIPSGEDYSQYKPRSYYAGDEMLESYFRAMMWYGRVTFSQMYEQQTRCALLSNLALGDQECYNEWYNIYEITSFMTGGSDDLNYNDYMPIIKNVYGENFAITSLIGNEEGWAKYVEAIKQLRDPQINSTVFAKDPEAPDVEWEDEAKGYRFMGQRFSLDGTIFQNLVYSDVKETGDHQKRRLPDALDIPAAFGSDHAMSILLKMGNGKYPNYVEKMEEMRDKVFNATSYWSSSISAGWLFTLAPLVEKKGEGYPSFMTNDEWQKKNLESFIGSWIELKHDTALYAKQPYSAAEAGGADETRKIDMRGYVEPEPELYARLCTLAKATKEGLQKSSCISSEDVKNLDRLIEASSTLRDISIRELQNQALTDEDYEFIEFYGGMLEHFWLEAVKEGTTYQVQGEDFERMREYGAEEKIDPHVQIIADVASNPQDGLCLEEALGSLSEVLVVFPVDGELHVAVGACFKHYQFEQPINERMTDTEWRVKMGYEPAEDGWYHTEGADGMQGPEWTDSYRCDDVSVLRYTVG